MFHSSKFCMPTQMKESLHFHETLGDYGACTETIQFSYQTNPPSLNTYTKLIEAETKAQRQQNKRTPLENHRKPASIRGSFFCNFNQNRTQPNTTNQPGKYSRSQIHARHSPVRHVYGGRPTLRPWHRRSRAFVAAQGRWSASPA